MLGIKPSPSSRTKAPEYAVNKDKFKRQARKVQDDVKGAVGDMSGDQAFERKGRIKSAAGKGQERFRKMID